MYIFKTTSVCAREIHFELDGEVIRWVRFVGGGCPGNADAVARLLEGKTLDSVIPMLRGIPCREGTSCPDQLVRAFESVRAGTMAPAPAIPVESETEPLCRVAVVADVNGNLRALERFAGVFETEDVQAVYCLGNLVARGMDNDSVVGWVRKSGWRCLQGSLDRASAHLCSGNANDDNVPVLEPRNRDFLVTLPLMRTFLMDTRKVLAFYDGFIQDLEGFSDYAPFSTEIIQVCDLSEYLSDESVFPALEAMTGQFSSDVVLFGHTGKNKHVRLGEVDFVNVGALSLSSSGTYTLLTLDNGKLVVEFKRI